MEQGASHHRLCQVHRVAALSKVGKLVQAACWVSCLGIVSVGLGFNEVQQNSSLVLERSRDERV